MSVFLSNITVLPPCDGLKIVWALLCGCAAYLATMCVGMGIITMKHRSILHASYPKAVRKARTIAGSIACGVGFLFAAIVFAVLLTKYPTIPSLSKLSIFTIIWLGLMIAAYRAIPFKYAPVAIPHRVKSDTTILSACALGIAGVRFIVKLMLNI